MFVAKRALSRRTMLRGMGTAVALPFLESMVPAFTGLRNTRARAALYCAEAMAAPWLIGTFKASGMAKPA